MHLFDYIVYKNFYHNYVFYIMPRIIVLKTAMVLNIYIHANAAPYLNTKSSSLTFNVTKMQSVVAVCLFPVLGCPSWRQLLIMLIRSSPWW